MVKRSCKNWVCIDFETFPIRRRPEYPPKPVGVAIKYAGKKAHYYAFAHPNGGNNSTYAEARRALKAAYQSEALCFHNAKFDLEVAHVHMGMPMPSFGKVYDTQLMLFIDDPRAKSYKLKPSAERLLGEPPHERDELIDWLVKHQPVPGVRLTKNEYPAKDAKVEYAGAYVAYAPVPLVFRYACGDVARTEKLAKLLVRKLTATEQIKAADVEHGILAPILQMERDGVPVDLKRLRADVTKYNAALAKAEEWLCKKMKAPVGTNWDSSATLLKLLKAAGLVDASKLHKTKKPGKDGKPRDSSSKDSLAGAVTSEQTLSVLKYRSRLCVSLRTFMEPWLEVAEKSKGFVYTTWNTTRTDDSGARTGRLSSTPNFQNLPKRAPYLFGTSSEGAKAVPAWWVKMGLPDLPNVRGYVVPLPGHVLVDRDYSQQELRIFAHYAEGELLAKYLLDNWLDVHGLVNARVNELMLSEISRDVVKRLVFATVYGMGRPGVARLSSEYGIPGPKLIEIADAVKKAVPGLIALNRMLRKRCDLKLPIRTWGGRVYYVEEPRIVDGKMRTFEYKMLNLLIQGSAADNTKRALLNFWEYIIKHRLPWRILMSVHDEFVLSVPRKDLRRAQEALRAAMADVEFDLPMLSEGKYGANWGALKSYDKKGAVVYQREERKAA
jgi:DNA polymerase I-like protein with 3'-5' exonuclease and polymerase domains